MSKAPKHLYEFGTFRLDPTAGVLFCEGKPVPVGPKVFETLVLLVERHGELVTKDEMMSELWPKTFVEEANLTQNIFTLRKILGEKNGTKFIETVPRRGYRFSAEVRSVPTAETDLILQQRTRTHLVVDRVSAPANRVLVIAAIVGAVGIALILFVAAPILRVKFGPSAPERSAPISVHQQPSIRRITYDSRVFNPAISRDGQYLALNLLTDTDDGPKESLRLQNIATGSSVEIMPPAMPGYSSLTFSPDGNYLYFATLRKGDKTGTIARVPVFGGTATDVARNAWSAFGLSHDGQEVVFVRAYPTKNPSQAVVATNVNDGKERDLFNLRQNEKWFNMYESAPAWSPDGKTIVLTGGQKIGDRTQGALFEVTVADGKISEIPAPHWNATSHVAWLTEGNGLIVVAQEKDAAPFQIWHVAYPSGEARKLTNDLHDYGRITLTADSRLVAAQQATRVSHVWLLPEGEDARQLTSGMLSDGHAGLSFSADGRPIFTSNRSGEYDIWQMNAEGGDLRQLTAKMGGRNLTPIQSPDGRYIVFHSNRSGVSNIWRADADGNNPVQLTDGAAASNPSISPDSGWVYYTSWRELPTVIEKVSIDGGPPVRITSNKHSAGFPSVSPDGKLLAYAFYDDEQGFRVALIAAEGGDSIKYFPHAANSIVRWAADSRAFIFIKPAAGNHPGANLWLQPLDGSPSQQLTQFGSKDDPITNFAISGDGKQILIARGRLYSDVVLLSDFR